MKRIITSMPEMPGRTAARERHGGIWPVMTLFLLLAISGHDTFAQLLQWNTYGNAGTETTEPSVYNDAGITASNLTMGNITAAGNANRFGGSAWCTGNLNTAISDGDYIEFIVTPNSGCSFTATEFVFSWQSSSSGPTNVALRSSADGFGSNLGSTAVTSTITQYTLTLSGLSNVATATTFRLYGYSASGSTGTGGFDVASNIVNVQLNGTTSCGTTPTIIVSPATLTGFTYVFGSGPSLVQPFDVSGTNLTANITLTAPTDYEISLSSGSGFGSSVALTPTGGTVSTTPIYVRLKAGLAVGNYNTENITATSTGASNKTVACSGTVTSGGTACATDLFISEYIEGSSNNKAIEIYNGTGAAINLASGPYYLYYATNGGAYGGTPITLTGTIAAGDVFVVANSSANAAILAQADMTTGSLTINGDDVISLFKGATLIDAIGQLGFDPGTEWGTGLTSTADNTLIRNSTITDGDNVDSDVFDPSAEWTGYATDYTGNLGTHTMNCFSNTITTGTVSPVSYAITCSAGASGTVAFTSTEVFNSGNVYTAQLSNASGSFASPVNIGSLTSTANGGTINITIPPGISSGSGYLIRVISSSPTVIGSTSSAITITLSGGPCSCFEIESILVDACGAGNVEGENEMFRFVVGSTPLNTSNMTVEWPSNSWLGICQNATTASIVSSINATITNGLGQLVEPVGGVIPAGAQVMFFTSTAFNYSMFDFSALNYTLYAVFQCPGNTAGHFVNYTGSGDRELFLNYTGCTTDSVTYNADSLYHGDGATVDFDVPGNPTYSDSGTCSTVPIFTLPVELLYFKTVCINDHEVDVYWATASETNNHYFTLESADEANMDFAPVANVEGAGSSNEVQRYSITVQTSSKYFRLKQTDFDGHYSYSQIISVDCNEEGIQVFPTLSSAGENITVLGDVSSIRVYDSMSREVYPEFINNTLCCLEPGFYFFVINNKRSYKVIVQ